MSEHGQRFNGNERASTSDARNALMQAFTRAVGAVSAPLCATAHRLRG